MKGRGSESEKECDWTRDKKKNNTDGSDASVPSTAPLASLQLEDNFHERRNVPLALADDPDSTRIRVNYRNRALVSAMSRFRVSPARAAASFK